MGLLGRALVRNLVKSVGAFFIGGGLACLPVACSVADIPGGGAPPASGQTPASTSSKGEVAADGCDATVPGVVPVRDPSMYEPCACKEGGKARCVTSGVPASSSRELAACEGGSCVPDTVLQTGKLASCHSSKKILGKTLGEGRCVSLCVPKVADDVSLLDRGDEDACAADERCVPCVNPADGEPSGLCDLQPLESSTPSTCGRDAADAGAITPTAPTTPKPLPQGNTCCGGRGSCEKRSAQPPIASTIFGDGDGDCEIGEMCLPVEQPVSRCTASPIAGRYSGVCLKDCLVPGLGFNVIEIAQGSCNDDETCVPCDIQGIPGCR